jgi:hypothetical protein
MRLSCKIRHPAVVKVSLSSLAFRTSTVGLVFAHVLVALYEALVPRALAHYHVPLFLFSTAIDGS